MCSSDLASSFATPLLASFGSVAGVHESRHGDAFETHPSELVLDNVALPLWSVVQGLAARLRPIQQGRLWIYLVYLMAALLLLLLYLATSGGTTSP